MTWLAPGCLSSRGRGTEAGLADPPKVICDSSVPSGAAADVAGRVLFLLALFLFASCTTPDRRHQVIVSIPDQRMALLEDGAPVAMYPVSTSRFGLGDIPGTRATPLGNLEIARKIGAGAPTGAVFKDRMRTGEIVRPDAPGRDPIVSRILWLRGLEPQNARAHSRYIYIHGTPEERNIGRPASYGCIRMRSKDVIQLFDLVGPGARVTIATAPLATLVPALAPTAPSTADDRGPFQAVR
jgi:L,D-transpeptidase-like protein